MRKVGKMKQNPHVEGTYMPMYLDYKDGNSSYYSYVTAISL